jgi:hypothetical protein
MVYWEMWNEIPNLGPESLRHREELRQAHRAPLALELSKLQAWNSRVNHEISDLRALSDKWLCNTIASGAAPPRTSTSASGAPSAAVQPTPATPQPPASQAPSANVISVAGTWVESSGLTLTITQSGTKAGFQADQSALNTVWHIVADCTIQGTDGREFYCTFTTTRKGGSPETTTALGASVARLGVGQAPARRALNCSAGPYTRGRDGSRAQLRVALLRSVACRPDTRRICLV